MSGYDIQQLINLSQYYGENSQRGEQARNLLDEFYKDENSYMYATQILESSQATPVIKACAISTLKDLILKRWDQISDEMRESIRNYIFGLVDAYGSDPNIDPAIRTTADLALVNVLIQEWPERYPNFFNELIENANSSELTCYNNIQIIKIFCEQVLENYEDLLAYSQAVKLSNCLQDQAEDIYKFLETVLTTMESSDLILIGLSTLKYFIKWIDPRVIVSTQVFEALCTHFLPQPEYVIEVLTLFYEIFDNSQLPDEFSTIIEEVFKMMISAINTYITSQPEFDFQDLENGRFIKILPMTITAFLDKFYQVLETPANIDTIQLALTWLLELMNAEDLDVLHTCCNFWLIISRRCHHERQQNKQQASALTEIYAPALPDARRLIIQNMQKPDDIIIVEDQSGNVVRESKKNTNTSMIYSTMKECLMYLTSLDPEDTIDAFKEMIDPLSREWIPDLYNRICWSVGAISRTLDFESEKTFITYLLRIQLQMSQSQVDPNERAIIASGIMHVCSQYPRFLLKFPKFLRTVVMKLFEFMHQDVEGVKDMAVASFKKISDNCKRAFCTKIPNSPDPPFIVEIINEYPNIVGDLTAELIIQFFDALSTIVFGNNNKNDTITQFDMLIEPLNEQWQECMDNFNPGDIEISRQIAFVLSCNEKIAFNMKKYYIDQFSSIFEQMMMAYQSLSQFENENVSSRTFPFELNRAILNAKSSVINVIKSTISKVQNPETNLRDIIPSLVEVIFDDYGTAPPNARTPEVLNLVSVLFTKMQDAINPYLNNILEGTFIQTVEMIKDDFEENPTFRPPFYDLLQNLVKQYLPSLIAVPEGFNQVIQTIQWGYQHPLSEICEKSLDTISTLIEKIKDTTPQIYEDFLDSYYIAIVADMFSILTDTVHKFAFDKNIALLAQLFKIENYPINAEDITNAITDCFPYREPAYIYEFINDLISKANNNFEFRMAIKDFLVTTRQFLPQDPDLNQEETNEFNQNNQQYINENVYTYNEGDNNGDVIEDDADFFE